MFSILFLELGLSSALEHFCPVPDVTVGKKNMRLYSASNANRVMKIIIVSQFLRETSLISRTNPVLFVFSPFYGKIYCCMHYNYVSIKIFFLLSNFFIWVGVYPKAPGPECKQN